MLRVLRMTASLMAVMLLGMTMGLTWARSHKDILPLMIVQSSPDLIVSHLEVVIPSVENAGHRRISPDIALMTFLAGPDSKGNLFVYGRWNGWTYSAIPTTFRVAPRTQAMTGLWLSDENQLPIGYWIDDYQWYFQQRFLEADIGSDSVISRASSDGKVWEVLTPDGMDVDWNAPVVLSPDGDSILFSLLKYKDDPRQDSDLYRMRVDGTGLENLTANIATTARAEIWPPNSDWMAVVLDHKTYRMRPDGSDYLRLTPLLDENGWEDGHLWLEKPRLVVFRSYNVDTQSSTLMGVSLDDGKLHWLLENTSLVLGTSQADWMLIEHQNKLAILKSDGALIDIDLGEIREFWNSVWPPDGQWLFFTAYLDGGGTRLYRIDGSGQVVAIADSPGRIYAAKWSPDGEWLMVNENGTDYRQYRLPKDAIELERINANLTDSFFVAWATDFRQSFSLIGLIAASIGLAVFSVLARFRR